MNGSPDQESRGGLLQDWWDLEAPGAAESPSCWSEPAGSPLLKHSLVVPRGTLIRQKGDSQIHDRQHP